eukprot:4803610-Pleurochrysis_carterae.AAC.1
MYAWTATREPHFIPSLPPRRHHALQLHDSCVSPLPLPNYAPLPSTFFRAPLRPISAAMQPQSRRIRPPRAVQPPPG